MTLPVFKRITGVREKSDNFNHSDDVIEDFAGVAVSSGVDIVVVYSCLFWEISLSRARDIYLGL